MSKVYDLNAEAGNREKRIKCIARDREVWMGTDDHKNNFVVVVLDENEVLCREKLPKAKDHLEALFDRLPDCKVWAVYEAGPTGYRMLRWLRDCGAEASMCAPSLVPTRDGDDIKTDRRDALKLARCLRGGMLDPIHDLTDQQYEHRELVRSRKQLVQQRSDIARQIKSKLLYHGIEVPDRLESSSWSNGFLEWLSSEPTGRPGIDTALESFVEMYRDATEKIRGLTREIRALAETDIYAQKVDWLTTAPGVGVLTAMTFLVELGDISRFDNCKEFAAYLGLVPSESSSGERIQRGGLIRGGNRRVRRALVQSSWQAIGQDDGLRQVYERIKHNHGRGGAKIAIVAVARRMALACRAMLRDGETWRSPKDRKAKRQEGPDPS